MRTRPTNRVVRSAVNAADTNRHFQPRVINLARVDVVLDHRRRMRQPTFVGDDRLGRAILVCDLQLHHQAAVRRNETSVETQHPDHRSLRPRCADKVCLPSGEPIFHRIDIIENPFLEVGLCRIHRAVADFSSIQETSKYPAAVL